MTTLFGTAKLASAQDLPDGPGKDVVLRVCSQCHEAAKATSVRLTEAGWTDTIERMKAFGAQGSDDDFAAILAYLSTHFKGDLEQPLDINNADALDLQMVLGLLRKESAAVIDYRAKHGAFKSMADLQGLDPAILKKIQSKQDRVVFRDPIKK